MRDPAKLAGWEVSASSSLDGLWISLGISWILGLITVGAYWSFFFARWSKRHHAYLTLLGVGLSSEGIPNSLSEGAAPGSRRTQRLGLASGIMIIVMAGLLALAFLGWDISANNGPFEIDEGLLWFLCWLALALLAMTWASMLFELRRAIDTDVALWQSNQSLQSRSSEDLEAYSWFLSGTGARIAGILLLNIVAALGLLPLVIFPPLAASSMNKYLNLQNRVWGLPPQPERPA